MVENFQEIIDYMINDEEWPEVPKEQRAAMCKNLPSGLIHT